MSIQFTMMRKAKLWLILVLVSALLVLLATSLTDSPTYDEPAHIASGLTYVKFSDLRFNSEHPPLIKFLSGLSLSLFYPDLKFEVSDQEMQDPYTSVIYDLGAQLFWENDPTKLLVAARIPVIFLTLLAIYFVYQLVVDLTSNEKNGLAAAILFAFEINVLANGSLVTTDMGLLTFWLGLVIFYLRFVQKEDKKNLLISGIFFGLALLTKYSAVFILPIIFIASLCFLSKIKLTRVVLSLATISVVAWIVIWLFYLPFGSPKIIWEELPAVQEVISHVKSERLNQVVNILPLPYYYRYGLKLINHHEAVGQLQFLAGRVGQFNWWWFYPLTFLLKISDFYLALFFISTYFVFKNRFQNQKLNFLLIMMGLYFLLVINSSMAFGMRILLPVVGFGAVVIGLNLNWLKDGQLLKMLLIFYILLTIVRFPYFFSSSNLLSAVSGSKHEIFIDSNLDWGQDLKRLSNWCQEKNIDSLTVLSHSSLPIEIYGIENVDIDQAFEQNGLLAVSSTKLNLPLLIQQDDEIFQIDRPYDIFKNYQIKAKLGSFVIYDLSKQAGLGYR